MAVYGNAVGGFSTPRTLILTDVDGNEFIGAVVGERTIFTANADTDIREGVVAATDAGVVTGSKIIPSYYASYGFRIIQKDSEATIPVPEYDYSNFMVVICSYNASWIESLNSTYVSIGDSMYYVGNNTKLSDVSVDANNEQINLGIVVTEKSILRYCVIKEEY